MQVATLFRETATLLGASMEAQDTPGSDSHNLKYRSTFSDGVMKQETRDDGYETSADMEMRNQGESHRLINHMHVTNMGMKCEPPDDPYSFVDDDPLPLVQPRPHSMILQNIPKKRGRKKKCLSEGLEDTENLMNGQMMMKKKLKDSKFNTGCFKERKKHDRFNGMPEEEVSKRTLPDHLALNLDIVIIGINPGLFAAYKGHHYAGPGNHFWKCLYLSGLTPEPMTADDDYKLLQVGIGFTNMVARPTKGSADLTRKEIKEGSQILLEKLQKFKPKIAVFNGKLIFEVFSGKKDFSFGRQPEFVDGTNTYMWVMPSSSARCAQLPRAADKVPFYAALKKFRDYLNGIISDLDESEVVFTDSKLKNYFEPEIKEESKDEHSFYGYNRLPTNGELTDLSNAIVKKEDHQLPVMKKKRGRPKKIKSDSPDAKKIGSDMQKKEMDNSDIPKKKRGRPKKVKADEMMMSPTQFSDHKNTPQMSSCFSPPIHSPSSYGQTVPTYTNQSMSQGFSQNQSPSEPHNYHQSPLHSQHFSQSPQPSSQAFTHSDLSSEISAAISSEHNLGSPSPTSPSIGPPDFEPPTSMPEDTSDEQHSTRSVKEDVSPNSLQKSNECRFSSPTPSNDGNIGYHHNYRSYQHDSEQNHSIIGYGASSGSEYNSKRNLNQDVSSKSLSGLESLVDQIPSIADGDTTHSGTVNSSEDHYDSSHIPPRQYHDESAYLGMYSNSSHYSNGSNSNSSSNYSPQFTSSNVNYPSSTANNYSLHHTSASMNFSVTSLANSSASVNHDIGNEVPNSFSVSNLAASNYTSLNSNVNSYSNLIGAHHPMGSHMMGGSNGIGGSMFGSGMSGGIVERACSMGSLSSPVGIPNHMSGMNMTSSSLPYPYRQYSHSASSYSSSPAGGFSYSPAHSIHMPSPNYPYPSPYSNSTYHQPSYLPNHVLDRIKQDRMDIGFGGF